MFFLCHTEEYMLDITPNPNPGRDTALDSWLGSTLLVDRPWFGQLPFCLGTFVLFPVFAISPPLPGVTGNCIFCIIVDSSSGRFLEVVLQG
jgi:hypothetical protein